jgi:hypothetical protein
MVPQFKMWKPVLKLLTRSSKTTVGLSAVVLAQRAQTSTPFHWSDYDLGRSDKAGVGAAKMLGLPADQLPIWLGPPRCLSQLEAASKLFMERLDRGEVTGLWVDSGSDDDDNNRRRASAAKSLPFPVEAGHLSFDVMECSADDEDESSEEKEAEKEAEQGEE